jgi:hypothetical protein
VPETVNTIKTYLRTDQFVVLTTEDHPGTLVRAVADAFKPEQTKDTDDGYFLELGHFDGIPAVQISDEVISIYFSAADEDRLLKRLKWQELKGEPVRSLPECPPIDTATALDLFETRVWVPMTERNTVPWVIQQAFKGYRQIYRDDREMLWVPGDSEVDLFARLDAYFERLAICGFEGNLTEKEATTVAIRQLTGGQPATLEPSEEVNHVPRGCGNPLRHFSERKKQGAGNRIAFKWRTPGGYGR